ncbi:IMV membrane protein A21, partial [Monkeypox virus]
YKR